MASIQPLGVSELHAYVHMTEEMSKISLILGGPELPPNSFRLVVELL